MKAGSNESSKKLVSGGALAVWLLLPLIVLVVLKTDCLPQVTVRQLCKSSKLYYSTIDNSLDLTDWCMYVLLRFIIGFLVFCSQF